MAGQILTDDRFGGLFTNPDYEIDEDDEDFKLRNPSGIAALKRKEKDDMDSDDDEESNSDSVDNEGGIFRRVESDGDEEDDDDEGDEESYSGDDSEDDDDGFRGAKIRGEAYDQMKAMRKQCLSLKRMRDNIQTNSALTKTDNRLSATSRGNWLLLLKMERPKRSFLSSREIWMGNSKSTTKQEN